MTFDNEATIIGVRIKLFVATVLMITYLVLAYVAEIIKFPVLGLEEEFWTFILVLIYILFIGYPSFAVYQFFYFSDEGDTLVFRYFTAGIIGGRKNSVVIPKNSFEGYKIETEYMGLRQYIVLYQRVGVEVAKYPNIYISALKKNELNKLVAALNRIKR
ncbi:MAG TPA: hypothetical protein GXZ49_03440 [Bacteroidetes bacterium]|nr:hypothetical protein [Bacteroidota bacterium]